VVAVLLLGHFYGGVNLSAGKWISLALFIWIGSMIFAALSVAMGYRLDPDSVQPATLLVYLPMILLGGTYFYPAGWLHKVAQALPTWQLHVICGDIVNDISTPASAYLVIAAWLAGFLALAVVAVVSANRQDS
jgi:ABC-2 type transport system permease protein